MSAAPAPRAVVLLSGGMDSATAAALAQRSGYEVSALVVDYGQRQQAERAAAREVAAALGLASVREVAVDLGAIGGSALTQADVPVPKDRSDAQIGAGVPPTYVPARNTLLLSLGLGLAEVLGAARVVIGANAVDTSGYPDCRPEFLEAFDRLAELGTRAGAAGRAPRVWAPLLTWSKARIVTCGLELGVPFGLTLSCYDPVPTPGAGAAHCGRCDACRLRRRGFEGAGASDPAPWVGPARGG